MAIDAFQNAKSTALSITEVRDSDTSALVRELRRFLQLAQEQFAAQVDGTMVTINRWENRKSKPSAMALRNIQSVLNQLAASPVEAHRLGAQSLLERYFSHPRCLDTILPSDRAH